MSEKKVKSPKQMERHLKGLANHYRLEILLLLDEKPGISLDGIVESLKANDSTIGEHTRRLTLAGLVNKKYKGNVVEHTLSPYGKEFVRFLKRFQQM